MVSMAPVHPAPFGGALPCSMCAILRCTFHLQALGRNAAACSHMLQPAKLQYSPCSVPRTALHAPACASAHNTQGLRTMPACNHLLRARADHMAAAVTTVTTNTSLPAQPFETQHSPQQSPTHHSRHTPASHSDTIQPHTPSHSSQSQLPNQDWTQPEAPVQEWPGLKAWRDRGVDLRRGWGEHGPSSDVQAPGTSGILTAFGFLIC